MPKSWKYRVPRVTADCLGARPIDLAVIDGIESNRAGEGPWAKKTVPVQPGLLLAGFNPLCTDAIAASVMGFDPLADHFQFPFRGENHLRLLHSVGVGEIDPKKIEVRGLPLKEAALPVQSQARGAWRAPTPTTPGQARGCSPSPDYSCRVGEARKSFRNGALRNRSRTAIDDFKR